MPSPTASLKRWFHNELLGWAESGGREFAWRRTQDPYQILLAEMMVHRTAARQADAVWQKFVGRYPTAAAAADASDDELMAHLAPLGLTWRARNIVIAARTLAGLDHEVLPGDLRMLRGVGHYAAAVVETVCFGERSPIVDANVVRIYSRFFGFSVSDSTRRSTAFHQLARALLPADRDQRIRYFWALMDFGAAVCRPRSPRCRECPIRSRCQYSAPYRQRLNSGGSNDTNSSTARAERSYVRSS